jgi:hypothetical protein
MMLNALFTRLGLCCSGLLVVALYGTRVLRSKVTGGIGDTQIKTKK